MFRTRLFGKAGYNLVLCRSETVTPDSWMVECICCTLSLCSLHIVGVDVIPLHPYIPFMSLHYYLNFTNCLDKGNKIEAQTHSSDNMHENIILKTLVHSKLCKSVCFFLSLYGPTSYAECPFSAKRKFCFTCSNVFTFLFSFYLQTSSHQNTGCIFWQHRKFMAQPLKYKSLR